MIKPSAIFKNGMVLQRNSRVAIFGETDCNHIEISFDGKVYEANINENKWIAHIPTKESVAPLSMVISGTDNQDEIIIEDILLGEVWLAGGQSNMELELQNSENGIKVMGEAEYDRIRFYNVPKYQLVDEELERLEEYTSWRCVRSGSCADMSAVAYYFATKLYEQLNVPIGIIDCYWGGTSATCWVDAKALKDVPKVQDYLSDWDAIINGKTDEEYDRELTDYNNAVNKWQSIVDELKAKNPEVEWDIINMKVGDYPWPPPKGRKSPFRPFGLHNSMVARITPYTVRGAIYYQGEEDAERADYYSVLNTAVINQWRNDFTNPDMPFFITQLPMFIAKGADDDGQWGVLRLEQEKCSIINDNVGIAVITDCGEFDNIHPIDKKTPGLRLAGQVLANVYKASDFYSNMKAVNARFNENICEILLDNTYGELHYRKSDGNVLTAKNEDLILENGIDNSGNIFGFEVVNEEGKVYKPQIEISGEMIRLIGEEGDCIKSARYAMFNYGVANMYNKHGLPLMPFELLNK